MDSAPVEVVVVGVDGDLPAAVSRLTAAVRAGSGAGVRLLGCVAVAKDADGALTVEDAVAAVQPRDAALDALLASLVVVDGLDDQPALAVGPGAGPAGGEGHPATQPWTVSDAVPAASSAVVLLLEHRWARDVRAAVRRVGGSPLEDVWVDAVDLAVLLRGDG